MILNTLQELEQSNISSKINRELLFGTALNPVQCGQGSKTCQGHNRNLKNQ